MAYRQSSSISLRPGAVSVEWSCLLCNSLSFTSDIVYMELLYKNSRKRRKRLQKASENVVAKYGATDCLISTNITITNQRKLKENFKIE